MQYRAIFISALLTSISLRSGAQTQKGNIELSLSMGRVSAHQINIASGGDRSPILLVQTGANYFVSFKYFRSKKLALGLSMGAQKISGQSNYSWTNRTQSSPFGFDMRTLTIAPELTLIYKSSKKFCFYGFAGAGYAHSFIVYYAWNLSGNDSYKITPDNISLQITPIGFRFGNSFAGFLELGAGYKGLLNCGLAYKI